MMVGACLIELHLPGVQSLKGKRRSLKSLLARLRREFNLAVAEVGHNDLWRSAQIALVAVANERAPIEAQLQRAIVWIERNRPDLDVVDFQIEWR